MISASTTLELLRFNEHSVAFLQLTDSLYVLEITLADIRPDRSIKKIEKK